MSDGEKMEEKQEGGQFFCGREYPVFSLDALATTKSRLRLLGPESGDGDVGQTLTAGNPGAGPPWQQRNGQIMR